jgi:uncharacterized protein YukE
VSALDGFYATWNDARNTFGEGTPQGGSQIDASPTFSKLGEDVQAAAPGDTWTGAGSEAYGGANKKHGENLTKLADLDRRLAAQLDQAADVVTTGRGNLDAVRQWVTDAANSVPPGKQRDELLMKIANSGLGQVSEIVQTSNDANNTIRDNMNRLKPEFEAIGFKEEKGDGEDPLAAHGDEEDKPGEEKEDKSAEEQGKKDGEALAEQAGTPSAHRDPAVLDEVADNLPGSPLTQEQTEALARGEQVDDVPPETLAYYREFYQAAGKDGLLLLDRHLEAQEAAGDADAGRQRDQLANGLTVTSNENIVERNPDGTIADRGGYDQLPPDLREMLEVRGGDKYPNWETLGPTEAKIQHVGDVVQFSELMGEANPGYQPGSRLGTEMYLKATDMVDKPGGWAMSEFTEGQYDKAANSLADVAGRNNAASAQIWSGTGDDLPDGYNREETVRTLMGHDWSESGTEGTGAATLLDWMTEETNRPLGDPIGDRARMALTEVPDMLAPMDNEALRNSLRDSFARNDAVSTEMAQLLAGNTEAIANPGAAGGHNETKIDPLGYANLSAADASRLLELGSYSEEGRVTLSAAVEAVRVSELQAAMTANPGMVNHSLDNSVAAFLSGETDRAMIEAIKHQNEVFKQEVENPRDAVYRAKILGAELAGIATDELVGKVPYSGPITDVTGLKPGELIENQIKEWIGKPEYQAMPVPETANLRAGAEHQAEQAILQAALQAGQLPPEFIAPNGQPIVVESFSSQDPRVAAFNTWLASRGLSEYVHEYSQTYGNSIK